MRYQVTIGDRVVDVELGPDGVRAAGVPVEVSLEQSDGTPVRGLLVDGRSYRVVAERAGQGRWRLDLSGHVVDVEVLDERTRTIREMSGAGRKATGPKPITAPMPGMVVKIEVSEGSRVEAGQGVAIVEAMKMENELRAAGPGVVRAVHAAPGEAVDKGQVLVELAPPGEPE